MKKNIIFVFTGTGNSLWAAKEISKELDNCEIVSMNTKNSHLLIDSYESIGFIYPTYAGGIPKRVKKFISILNLNNNINSFFFAIATCGRISRAQNAISQLYHLLKHKGIKLNYGERLDMFSNYVVGYEMRDTIDEEAEQSSIDLKPMVNNIKNHIGNKLDTRLTPRHFTSIAFRAIVSNMDKNFEISDECVKCRICEKVCPANNITAPNNSKPHFMHNCEHCLACLQNCPKKAINYKHKTQNRKRYIHPSISWKDLAILNGYEHNL